MIVDALLSVVEKTRTDRASRIDAILDISWMAQRMNTNITDLDQVTTEEVESFFAGMLTFAELDDDPCYDHVAHNHEWSRLRSLALKKLAQMACPL